MAPGDKPGEVGETARKAFVVTLVALSVVVGAIALWHIRIVIALLFLGFTIAAAMRPGVDALQRRRIPRSAGVMLHYLALAGLFALFLWLVVPRALDQIGQAVGNVPTSQAELKEAAHHSTGIKHDILVAIQKRLEKLPSGGEVIHPAVTITTKAFEVVIGIFFMFATAAYWMFERERAIRLVLSVVPRRHRKTTRDTWDLIDAKLGAFVRGELLLIAFVAGMLAVIFWLIGLPYWLLIAIFAGIVEIVPVIGPLAAGALAIGVGLTESWQLAVWAGLAVLGVRLLEDYLVIPRVLGHAVGLSPLLVLVSVTATGLLLGGFYVILAVPLAAMLGTIVDVVVRDKDPSKEEVPTVLFPAKEREA